MPKKTMDTKLQSTQTVFLNLNLRLYTLRLTILNALVALLTSIGVTDSGLLHGFWPALLSVVIIHHVARLKFVPGIIDLSLTLAETVGSVFYARQLPKVRPYDPEISVYHAVASWTVVACLVLLSIFRLATVVLSRGKTLLKYDFLEREGGKRITIGEVFFGRSFWTPRFKGEGQFVTTLRGFLGLVFTLFLIFFATIHLVFEPIRETALIPIQEHRTTSLPPDHNIAQGLWNIMIPLAEGDVIGQEMIQNAFTVVPSPNNMVPVGVQQRCLTLLAPTPSRSKQDNFTAVTFQCFTTMLDSRDLPEIPRSVTIVVNFTQLSTDALRTQHIPLFLDPMEPAVTVVVAMTNQTVTGIQPLLRKTPPLSIEIDTNLVAAVSKDIREIFKAPTLAAIGLYQVSSSFWTPRFTNIYRDPRVIPVANISTLRLYIPIFGETVSELSIFSDVRDDSVLSGFATVGGLWTALSGTFAMIFGASLLHFLRGSKSISLLGLAHFSKNSKRQMKDHCLDKFPGLLKDQNAGLLTFIKEYVIDLDFLDIPHQSPDVEKQKARDSGISDGPLES